MNGILNYRRGFLDLLRFFASASVPIAHIYNKGNNTSVFATLDLQKNYSIFYSGSIGVIIFFLISGYIIPSTIERSSSIKIF